MAAYQLEDVLISYLFQTLEIPGKRLRRWRDSGELVHRALVELAEFEAYCEVRPDIGPLVKAYKSQAWSNKEAGKIETSSIELVRSTRRFTKGSGETEDEGAPDEPGELREEWKQGEVQGKGKGKGKGKGRKVKKKKPDRTKGVKPRKTKQKKQEDEHKNAIPDKRDDGRRSRSGRGRERSPPRKRRQDRSGSRTQSAGGKMVGEEGASLKRTRGSNKVASMEVRGGRGRSRERERSQERSRNRKRSRGRSRKVRSRDERERSGGRRRRMGSAEGRGRSRRRRSDSRKRSRVSRRKRYSERRDSRDGNRTRSRERERSRGSRGRRNSRAERDPVRGATDATPALLRSLIDALKQPMRGGGAGQLGSPVVERELRRKEFLAAARRLQDGDA